MKGCITLNGIEVVVSTDTPQELVSIIQSIVGVVPKNEVVKTSEHHIATLATSSNVVLPRKTKKKYVRHTYYEWSEKDVIDIARLVLSYGPNREGLGKIAHDMTPSLEEKRRNPDSVRLLAHQLHAYFYQNKFDAVTGVVRKMIEKSGLRLGSTTSSNSVSYSSQRPEYLVPKEA